MNNATDFIKLFTDETRIRLLMLLKKEELCVCQIMGIMGISQPLISRNLAMLSRAGIVTERRHGKLAYYRIADPLPPHAGIILGIIEERLAGDPKLDSDIESLADCHEFQKTAVKCDMKTFRYFIAYRDNKRAGQK